MMRTTKEYLFESSRERLEEMIPFILNSVKKSEQLSNEVVEELMNTVNYPPTLKRWVGLRASQQLAYCSEELEDLLSLHTCTRKSLTRF